MSKVSVITPAYNAAAVLADTVECVLQQTYQNWEMIIVDDCSPDDTYKVACGLAEQDERIRVIRHEQNQGVAAARNTALRAATGEYIAFLDSDDLWLPNKLELQLAFMKEKDCVLSYTAYQSFDAETGEKGKVITAPEKMQYKDIFKNTAIACLTVMVDKQKSGPFEMPPLSHAEDQCTWQAILGRENTAYGMNESLSLYRVSGNSLSGNKMKAIKKQWHMYRKYHKLSLIKSAWYFSCYALNAVMKRI